MTTAAEIKRELRAQLESTKNGNTPRWAVFEELRLGAGFARGGISRTAIRGTITHLRRAKKEGRTTIGDIDVDQEIERLSASLHDPDLDRRESRIDVFALDCYSSGNYQRRAYEIKCSRSDLFAELRDPSKRAPWLELVTAFYIVIPKGLATVEEILELAPEVGVMYYTPMPDKPRISLCTCEDKPRAHWLHAHDCPYAGPAKAYEKASRGRRINTARRAMALGGTEPSWEFVASILRAAAAR